MLSIFPGLFTYALAAPFFLRLALGSFFILQGMRRVKADATLWETLWGGKKIGSRSLASVLAKVQIVIGIFLFVGLYTQIAAILTIIFVWVELYKKRKVARPSFQEIWMTILISAICISFLFLGAGLLAFDLPL